MEKHVLLRFKRSETRITSVLYLHRTYEYNLLLICVSVLLKWHYNVLAYVT